MQLINKFMVIMYGPTGVGKTDAALALARHLPAEIINMDMGQFYTPLSIGTAKPDWRSHPTPHHLFDIVDQPSYFTVAHYRQKLVETLEQIWQRGNLPIIVGGSGFYLKSIFFPPEIEQASLPSHLEQKTPQELWDLLHTIDSERAAKIHTNDVYRIKRALAIWYATGKKPSGQVLVYAPPAPFLLYCLTRDRAQLYSKIDARVHVMMQEGWLQEVERLRQTPWQSFLYEKKIIGYDDLFSYLDGEQTEQALQVAIHAIQQKTRNYAKRQMTFWRMLERQLAQAMELKKNNELVQSELAVINLTLFDLDLYINQLLKRLRPLFK